MKVVHCPYCSGVQPISDDEFGTLVECLNPRCLRAFQAGLARRTTPHPPHTPSDPPPAEPETAPEPPPALPHLTHPPSLFPVWARNRSRSDVVTHTMRTGSRTPLPA